MVTRLKTDKNPGSLPHEGFEGVFLILDPTLTNFSIYSHVLTFADKEGFSLVKPAKIN
jgi:hypothetical protein